jgi:hypothetical protein
VINGVQGGIIVHRNQGLGIIRGNNVLYSVLKAKQIHI